MGFYGCIPWFVKNHGSLILTVLSGFGLVGTAVAAAKVAPKAEKELQDELHWKIHDRVNEMMDEAEANGHGTEPEDWTDDEHAELYDIAERETRLTVMEKIKVAGPIYAPVILLGLGTLGCMAGAQILNTKQQAALMGAYALLQKDFGAYRREIRNEYGAEADRKAWIESQKKVKSLEAEVKRLEEIKNVCTFGIATLPGVIFRSDMGNIERAFLHFNRNLILRGYGDLDELYSFIGLPDEMWHFIENAPDEAFGWNAYMNEVEYGCSFIDYRLEEVSTNDGQKAYLINFDIPPYRIDGPEYDEEEPGEFYDGYDPEEAKKFLAKGIEKIPLLIDSTTHNVYAPGMY